MNLFELFVKIGADTSQAEKGMKNTQKNSETLTNKIKVMSAQFESAQKNVDKLTQEFNESVKKTGATSKETQELAKKLDDAEKEAEQAKKALDGYNSELGETETKTEKAGRGLSNFASKLGKGLATAAKIGTAAVGAAAAGITALTTAAVNNYAEYEQLVGGVDTLFKDASEKVQQYASEAYRTAGMSANDYMANATAFSASLISSLGGDTEKAAEYANRAMVSMSDNANKMGTSLDSIVQTYQSLSRGNMAMLDNLKLGYGGTKAELERLIKDAASYTDIQKEMGITVDASSMSFDNIVNAIAVVQGKLGIAGATAAEAGTTIEGSVNSMKAAWSNLVTGIANDNANMEDLIVKFVNTITGDGSKENLGVIGNILPRIGFALEGAVKLIEGIFPVIIEALPGLIETVLPTIVTGALTVVQSFVQSISDNGDLLTESAIGAVMTLVGGILGSLPEIVKSGLDLIVSLANGIAESLPELIPTIIDVVLQIVETLTNPETLTNLLDAAMVLIENLAYGLMDAIPQLVQVALLIIENLVAFLLDPANLAKLLKMAFDIIVGIGTGLINAIPELLKSVTRIITGVIAMFKDADWGKIGKDLVDGFKRGISNAWSSLKTWFKNLFGDLIGIAKKILGIASPSKVFKKIGGFTAEGFGAGFEDEFAHVKDDMEDALNFDNASVGINASIRKVGAGAAGGAFGGTSIGNININIDGAKYDDEQSLAIAVAEEIQRMTDRRSAVYA